jgi:ethanolamine-phosphate cytidylyltransferase
MTRVYVHIASDFCHVGILNLLEQAKRLGDKLVVGIPDDATVQANRNYAPLVPDHLRAGLLEGCRIVDEVLTGAPWVTTIDWMQQHSLHLCVVSDSDRLDSARAAEVATAGMLRVLPAMPGISALEIMDRVRCRGQVTGKLKVGNDAAEWQQTRPGTPIVAVENTKDLVGKRVYCAVTADLFHIGHVNFLRQAKECGAHLTVGVCSDELVESYKRRPCMSHAERVKLVSSCRYVDRVIPNAPAGVTDDFMKEYDLDLVVHGSDYTAETVQTNFPEPAARGCVQPVSYTSGISTTDLMHRCVELSLETCAEVRGTEKGKRVYVLLASDFCHVGHINLLEQAKQLGDTLVVGVPDDETIKSNRSYPPLVSAELRAGLLEGCRIVDEVLIGAPWVTTMDWMQQHSLDLCVVSDSDAVDADRAAEVRAAGRLLVLPAFPGISSLEIIDRVRSRGGVTGKLKVGKNASENWQQSCSGEGPGIPIEATTNSKDIAGKRVYCAVTADLFHIGHVNFLRQAKECGAHLTVGVCSDELVQSYKRKPCMSHDERVKLVSSCCHVDRVIPKAPAGVTDDFMKDYGLDLVVHGSDYTETTVQTYFSEPAARGCVKAVSYTMGISTTDLMNRCVDLFPDTGALEVCGVA